MMGYNAKLCLFIFVACISANLTDSTVDCDVDHVSIHSNTCRVQRDRFLHIYTTHKSSADRRNKVLCGSYNKFYKCMRPVLSACDRANKSFHQDLGHVHKLLDCACKRKQRDCKRGLRCVGREMQGVMYQRCQAYYHFQKTETAYSVCFITREFLSCQYGLVEECGESVALAALQMSRLNLTVPQHCNLSNIKQQTGFRYSDKCSRDLPEVMKQCADDSLAGNHHLQFHRQNDLISVGAQREVRRACRALGRYDKCLSGTCREGATLVYDMDGALRIYLIKLRYICEDAFIKYPANLGCLQSMVANQTLNKCDPVISSLDEHSAGLTAQQFYCKHPAATPLHRTFDKLQDCFRKEYQNKCGRLAGNVMAGLMERVRYDPYYLPYKFRVICHTEVPMPVTVVPPSRERTTHNLLTSRRRMDSTSVISSPRSQTDQTLQITTSTTLTASTYKDADRLETVVSPSLNPEVITKHDTTTDKQTTEAVVTKSSTTEMLRDNIRVIPSLALNVSIPINTDTKNITDSLHASNDTVMTVYESDYVHVNTSSSISDTYRQEQITEGLQIRNDSYVFSANETIKSNISIQIDSEIRLQNYQSFGLSNFPSCHLVISCLTFFIFSSFQRYLGLVGISS